MTTAEIGRSPGSGAFQIPKLSPPVLDASQSQTRGASGKGKVVMFDVINTSMWRGFGGHKPAPDAVDFQRQLDKVSLWLDQWDHEQRCNLLEVLLYESNYKQSKFIWTVVQPAIHRDFMYTAKKEIPALEFTPISSYSSRKLRDRQAMMRQDTYHRLKSAHLQRYEQVKQVNTMIPDHDISREHTRLPAIASSIESPPVGSAEFVTNWKLRPGIKRAQTITDLKVQRVQALRSLMAGSQGSQAKGEYPSALYLDGRSGVDLDVINNKPACIRFIEMPVKRHIQDEESPDWQENVPPEDLIIASQLSLREWKKRIRKKRQLRKSILPTTALSAVPLTDALPKKKLMLEARRVLHWYSHMWSDVQRNEFLHKFLLKLDPRQYYFISSFLAFRQYRDFIGLLPQHLCFKILANLSPLDLTRGMRVNKHWNNLCNDNHMWELKCEEVIMEVPVTSRPGEDPDWKQLYRENKSLRHNWLTGKCHVIDCKGHKDKVLCVIFDQSRLFTGSMDRTIKIWDILTGKCMRTLRGHQRGVWCLGFFTKSLLLSGSYDCTIKVWNLRTGQLSRTLVSHEGPVWDLALNGYTLVSASQDKTAKVWDASRCMLLHTLESHTAAVFCVAMDEDGKMIITGSADRSIRLWNTESGRLMKIVWVSQTTSVMTLSFSHGFFATSYDNIICLYTKEGKLVKTYEEHLRRIESLQLRIDKPGKLVGTIVSASKDGSIKYWDVTKNKSVQNFSGHNQSVNCIICDETRIASASFDNRIKIWDFNVTEDPESDEEDVSIT